MLFIFSKASEYPTCEELGPVAAIRKVQRFGHLPGPNTHLVRAGKYWAAANALKCKGKWPPYCHGQV